MRWATSTRFYSFPGQRCQQGHGGNKGTPKGDWYLDTFLKNGKTNEGLTLIDSTKLHEGDNWYWAAMVYDGKKMTTYVNASLELEGDVNFVPMTTGEISLGVRLNKVNWFKGQIKEIRFNPVALEQAALQQP
ncbi:MAG: LamG-like jellyroll fold domain-containing protein [Chitinophagaceae bacterium]